MKNNKSVFRLCVFAFCANMLLFFVKLYIGLRTDSISIYSDAVNNLFDSLSGGITFVGMTLAVKKSGGVFDGTVRKTEQLFSFIISLTVTAAGFLFAYNSLERLMYPTPMWFSTLYAWIIGGTAAAKGLMFFIYRWFEKKTSSPIAAVMKTDCVLDMFITLITLVTLIVSKYETYAVDAVCGIVISVIIIISAVKLLLSSARALVNYVRPELKVQVGAILNEYSDRITVLEISYLTENNGIRAIALVAERNQTAEDEIFSRCLEKTGIGLYFVENKLNRKEVV